MEYPLFEPSASTVSIFGRHFIDPHGRILHLRGANVAAASKVPNDPPPPIHLSRQASYVGRPFPLDQAEEHWRRLKSWGLTFLRITVTWDAIEHAGLGQYDLEYLAYLKALLEIMKGHGVAAYVALHQDVFSRYCGGSGAPGWTLEAAGFDLSDDGEKLALSGAAFLDGTKGGRLCGERGLWPTGYQKLACGTMSTLFWGGETFAPSLQVSNGAGQKVNIQQYLQDAFLGAFDKLVEAVGDVESVLGFELMNEPHPGFIGLPTIHEWNYKTDLHLGQVPSPLQSFAMGAGHPTPGVPHYVRSFPYPTRVSKKVVGNPTGVNVWLKDGATAGECLWQRAGVWRWSDQKSTAMAMQEDYFTKDTKGKKVSFYDDFYFPFVRKWEQTMQRALAKKNNGKGKIRMVGTVPNEYCPEWQEDLRPSNMVYTPHWYDLNALFKKQFGNITVNVQGLSRGMFLLKALHWGESGAKKNYARQINNQMMAARLSLGLVPIIFGECGVPMDLNKEEGFRTSNWKWQERMMDAMLSAFESSVVGFTLWTYNPGNREDIGDDWNAENFSWYSEERRLKEVEASTASETDLDAGAKLLNAIVRPYPVATSGTPVSLSYSASSFSFTYRFRTPVRPPTADSDSSAPLPEITEIFLPSRVYKEGKIDYAISSGGRMQFDWDKQRLFVWFSDVPDDSGRIVVEKTRRVDIWVPKSEKASQGLHWLWAVFLVVIAVLVAWRLQLWQYEEERRVGIQEGDWLGVMRHTYETLAALGKFMVT